MSFEGGQVQGAAAIVAKIKVSFCMYSSIFYLAVFSDVQLKTHVVF